MRHPYLVETAWSVVTRLVKDWHENPSMFSTEHDVQAELYSRLKTTFLNLGIFYLKDRDNDKIIDKKHNHLWPRITCEPTILYQWQGKPAKMKPDIVIWDDIDKIDKKRYSEIEQGIDNWPMVWACEIKFSSDFASSIEQTDIDEVKRWFRSSKRKKDYNWDMNKMKTLISYGVSGKPYFGARYAAVLNLIRIIAPNKGHDGMIWDDEYKAANGKLWMLHAYLPGDKFLM